MLSKSCKLQRRQKSVPSKMASSSEKMSQKIIWFSSQFRPFCWLASLLALALAEALYVLMHSVPQLVHPTFLTFQYWSCNAIMLTLDIIRKFNTYIWFKNYKYIWQPWKLFRFCIILLKSVREQYRPFFCQ